MVIVVFFGRRYGDLLLSSSKFPYSNFPTLRINTAVSKKSTKMQNCVCCTPLMSKICIYIYIMHEENLEGYITANKSDPLFWAGGWADGGRGGVRPSLCTFGYYISDHMNVFSNQKVKRKRKHNYLINL